MLAVKLSLIIPIYNTQQFLAACLESLICQSLPEIEFILVDDGSTDLSAQICQAYVKRDQRFSYHYLENSGVSAARNYGLGLARGDYIGFVDSDDYLSPDFCELMYHSAHTAGAIFSCCGVYKVTNTDKISYLPQAKLGQTKPGQARPASKFFREEFHVRNPVWNKIFKRQIIEDYQVRFPSVGYYVEDFAFVFMFFVAAEGLGPITYVQQALYYYVQHPKSMMSNLYLGLARSIHNLMLSLAAILQFLHQNNQVAAEHNIFKTYVVNYFISELPLWLIKQALLKHDFTQLNYAHLFKLFYLYQRKYGVYLPRISKLTQIEHICKAKSLYRAKFNVITSK